VARLVSGLCSMTGSSARFTDVRKPMTYPLFQQASLVNDIGVAMLIGLVFSDRPATHPTAAFVVAATTSSVSPTLS